jgi:hypothetical protein
MCPGSYSARGCLVGFFHTLLRCVLSLFGARPSQDADKAGEFVRVRVLKGYLVSGPLPNPNPKQSCDVDTPRANSWCARNVPVPDYSTSGAPLTVVAWLMSADGSSQLCAPASTIFQGGGPSPVDCCSWSGSGTGFSTSAVARELAAHGPLEVAIGDGPNAGLHRATAVASFTWALIIHGVGYRVCGGDSGSGMSLQGPSFSVPAASVDANPFSAVFPGKALGARADVVVIKA